MVHDVRSKFIIWGRHLGGEQYVRGNTQITNTSSANDLRSGVVETGAGSITDWYRSNTEHLHIVENTFYEDKLDERPGVNLQQYAAHLIGWDYSNTSNWVNNADGWPKAIANLEANFGKLIDGAATGLRLVVPFMVLIVWVINNLLVSLMCLELLMILTHTVKT